VTATGETAGAVRDREPPRLTPFELLAANGDLESETLPRIAAEAGSRGVDALDPGTFVMLATVGNLLREMQAPRSTGDRAAGTGIAHFRALAYQLFRFWREGKPFFVAGEDVLRSMLARAPDYGRSLADPPAPAGYLQLPRNLVWASVAPDEPPEPLDGLHWAVGDGRRLDIVIVLGIRTGRPGVSVIDLSVDIASEPPEGFANLDARDNADDFSTTMPGGEIRGLFSLVNAAEVIKLVARAFAHADGDAEPVDAPAAAADEAAGRHGALPPSRLPARFLAAEPAARD
jgi:hypothetical protein